MSDRDLSIPPPPVAGSDTEAGGAANQVLLLTGMSGAGRTTALKCLEDLGFEAVDNVPLSLLGSLTRMVDDTDRSRDARPLAIGIDIRSRDFGIEAFVKTVEELRRADAANATLVFLDCSDDELGRRYAETRHRHPLALDRPLIDGIRHERRLLGALCDRADLVIDTTTLRRADLERILRGHFAPDRPPGMAIQVTSFGFAQGIPHEAQLVFDVRFLRNPHYLPDLKPLTGRDSAVADYVAADDGFVPFFEGLTRLLGDILPRYTAEGRPCIVVAIGCTGGRHRSVFIAERLATWFRDMGYPTDVNHRDSR